jgi:hypothetical protein
MRGRARLAGSLVFIRIKPRETLPKNLVPCIALGALRARVPACYLPLRAESINRVMDDAIHEKAEAPFGLSQNIVL